MEQNETKPKKKTFKEQFEEDQQKTDQAIKAFNIDDFVTSPEVMRKVQVPGVGEIIFKVLSYDEVQQVHGQCKKLGITDPQEQGFHIIAEMMHKADGTTTPEKLHKIPGNLTNKIVERLGKESGFL